MGFKTEQFVENVDENLKCSICFEVLEDPWQCKDGHIFCKYCITPRLETRQICPVLENALRVEDLARNLGIKNMIENLQVYCHPPESDGQAAVTEEESEPKCDWTGKFQSLAKHRETCPFQQVQCPNEGCNTNMQRRELEDHDTVCQYKVVECEKCGKALLRCELPVHIDVHCPEEMVPCPNSCISPETRQINKIKRIDVMAHVTYDCPKTNVDCPYKEHGCGVMVERQDVDKHVQENRDAHMMLLAKQCSTLSRQNTTLTEQCSALKRDLESLSEENRLLKDEVKKCDERLRPYTWKIEDYLDHHNKASKKSVSLSDEENYPIINIRSPTFWLCGYNWYLVLHPYGINKYYRGYVSVYLCKGLDVYESSSGIQTTCGGVSVSCRLSVMSHETGSPDVSSQKSGVLPNSRDKKIVIEWPKFMRSDKAVSETYCVKQTREISTMDRFRGLGDTSGSLTIQCAIQLDKPQ